ncbi:hypothetical protein AKJ09_06783 [Labilithrix luteola]|uniref:Uncharacterized protein n=1 Tax=Labilithrix luteola TaxID=1391654 RepID=A0A0K1Q406_9BACT|nr:hypothetical protein [Labilithrix luteola]AKV00120.1 hypothetical protein AKJ09_06783 [Labilithrix luteola]
MSPGVLLYNSGADLEDPVMHSYVLRLGVASVCAALPIIVLACGDDPAAATAVDAAAPSAGGDALEDGAKDAGPQTISVTFANLGALAAKNNLTVTASVVFYPKTNPDKPVVEPIAFDQTVTKPMPDGAHVLLAMLMSSAEEGDGAYVFQIDDVAPGESINIGPAPIAEPSTRAIIRSFEPFGESGGRTYAFRSCMSNDVVPPGEEVAEVDNSCVESGGKARFLATVSSAASEPLAIGVTVADVNPTADGGPPLVKIPSWSTPTPTAWSFTGETPGAQNIEARAYVTNGTTPGVMVGGSSVAGAGTILSFLRPPAGFNDGEVHLVTASFGDAIHGPYARVTLVDRTAPTAPLATDLGTLIYFKTAAVSPTATGAASFDYTASTAFPSGTMVYAQAIGTRAGAGGPSTFWFTITPRIEQGHVDGLVLPDALRETILGSAMTWKFYSMKAVSGIEPRALRALDTAGVYSFTGTIGLPPGNFRASISTVTLAN